MHHRRRILAAAATAALAAPLTACGSSNGHHTVVVQQPAVIQPAAVSYAPAAFGQNGQCYWVNNISEVQMYIADGLCQPGWIPARVPVTYEETLWLWLSSPAYYNKYVPQNSRTTYINVTIVNFPKTHPDLSSYEKQAVYKDSTGKTVAASAIPTAKMTFGSNVTAKPTFGGVNTPPKPSTPATKPVIGGGWTAPPPPKVTPR